MNNIILNSNSKETYVYWLRVIKNNLYTNPNPTSHPITLNDVLKAWLMLYKKTLEREHITFREFFNRTYGIAIENGNKTIKAKWMIKPNEKV